MPRNKVLSDLEKGQIIALKDKGESLTKIGRNIGRSRKVIYNFLSNIENYGKNKSGGRKKKLSEREQRIILNKASNSTKSCRQLADCVPTKVCRTTVWNVLKQSKHICRRKMKKVPRLLSRHIDARLQFCKQNMDMCWTNVVFINWRFFFKHSYFFMFKVIFSDEKKFNLDGPDGSNGFWRDLRKEQRYFSKRNFGGGSLMVWGAFSADGCLELQVVPTKMNSEGYCRLLQCSLLPYIQNSNKNYTFQHDNAAVHASKKTKEWLAGNNVEVLNWPACSPDLNPIENIWGILVRRIYAGNRQFSSVTDLKSALFAEWDALDSNIRNNLIKSMKNRIFDCIKAKGGVTNY